MFPFFIYSWTLYIASLLFCKYDFIIVRHHHWWFKNLRRCNPQKKSFVVVKFLWRPYFFLTFLLSLSLSLSLSSPIYLFICLSGILSSSHSVYQSPSFSFSHSPFWTWIVIKDWWTTMNTKNTVCILQQKNISLFSSTPEFLHYLSIPSSLSLLHTHTHIHTHTLLLTIHTAAETSLFV